MQTIVLIGVLDVTMEFEECDRRKCMSVNVRADDLPDPLATSFNLSLTRTSNLNPRIILQPEADSELHLSNINFITFVFFIFTIQIL